MPSGHIADAFRTIRDDLRVVAAQFGRQDIFFHAGSVAYSALLAGVPFLLLLGSAIGFLLGHLPTASDVTIERFLSQVLPDQAAATALPFVSGALRDAEAQRSALGLVGAPLFAWFSTRFFGALRSSLGTVFDVERGHPLVRGKLYDMLYVVLGTVLVTVYLGLYAYIGLGTRWGGALLRSMGVTAVLIGYYRRLVSRVVATAFLAAMFTGLYKLLPNRKVPWRSAIWGGAWGATLFEIARTLIFQLVGRSMNPASIYSGILATIVVIVFWAYYAAVIFLIGGVVARMHEVRGARRVKPVGS